MPADIAPDAFDDRWLYQPSDDFLDWDSIFLDTPSSYTCCGLDFKSDLHQLMSHCEDVHTERAPDGTRRLVWEDVPSLDASETSASGSTAPNSPSIDASSSFSDGGVSPTFLNFSPARDFDSGHLDAPSWSSLLAQEPTAEVSTPISKLPVPLFSSPPPSPSASVPPREAPASDANSEALPPSQPSQPTSPSSPPSPGVSSKLAGKKQQPSIKPRIHPYGRPPRTRSVDGATTEQSDGRTRIPCPRPGCIKRYLNPGGVRYHIQRGTCVFAESSITPL